MWYVFHWLIRSYLSATLITRYLFQNFLTIKCNICLYQDEPLFCLYLMPKNSFSPIWQRSNVTLILVLVVITRASEQIISFYYSLGDCLQGVSPRGRMCILFARNLWWILSKIKGFYHLLSYTQKRGCIVIIVANVYRQWKEICAQHAYEQNADNICKMSLGNKMPIIQTTGEFRTICDQSGQSSFNLEYARYSNILSKHILLTLAGIFKKPNARAYNVCFGGISKDNKVLYQ